MSDPQSTSPTVPDDGGGTPPPPTAADGWVPDILPGFERLTLELEPDEEGDVVATLVRPARTAGSGAGGGEHAGEGNAGSTPEGDLPDAGVDVLYVHGWNDYFFQTHVADFWERQGARFFALDLRKYGRSIREHQTPGFIRDLSTYDEEIGAALVTMGHPAPAPATDGATALVGADGSAPTAVSSLTGVLPAGGLAAAAVRALFSEPLSELLSRGSTAAESRPLTAGSSTVEDASGTGGPPAVDPAPDLLTSASGPEGSPELPSSPAATARPADEGRIGAGSPPTPPPPTHVAGSEPRHVAHPGETLADAAHMEPDPGRRKLLLVGHSTGGLILSLWVSRHSGWADGLVLNSPWLEFQTRNIGRRLLEPGVRMHAALAPQNRMVNVDLGLYTRSISSRFDGEWDYDPTLRSDAGWHATPAWLSAILQGQEAVAKGLGITVPVLVLFSASSSLPLVWSEAAMHTDTVLDVVGVARRSADLGSHVTIVRVEGALHDVTLSAAPVREVVWTETERWFAAYMGPRPTARSPRH
ncbi:alpha/beta hydrolase [Actinomyces polynesiensis]|uniref:alpha/beta hydrolase n=1 Tax=Actinomyces polynesiensis TaxID=1325934 RepID=UPI0018CF5E5A|nr:alpha/beta hydrolase [Actinomyces polynesiensis]